jgi:hypothetical protein
MDVLSPRKTAQTDFFPNNLSLTPLFSVRPDISAQDALEQASAFLDIARHTVDGLVDGYSEHAAFSAAHMIDFAKALVDACHAVEVSHDR